MFLAMYATLCEKTFYGLGLGGSCVPIADGISVMYKDPQVVCGSAEHYKYMIPSYISLVVYVAGIPAFVTGIVFYLRAKNLMANARCDSARVVFCFLFCGRHTSRYFIWKFIFVSCVTSKDRLCSMLLCRWQSADHAIVALQALRARKVLVASFVTVANYVSGGTAGARAARFKLAGTGRLEQGIIICTLW